MHRPESVPGHLKQARKPWLAPSNPQLVAVAARVPSFQNCLRKNSREVVDLLALFHAQCWRCRNHRHAIGPQAVRRRQNSWHRRKIERYRRNPDARLHLRRSNTAIPRRSHPFLLRTLAPHPLRRHRPHRRSLARPHASRKTRAHTIRGRTSWLPGHLPQRCPDSSARSRNLSWSFSSSPIRSLHALPAIRNVVAPRSRKITRDVSATFTEPRCKCEHIHHAPQPRPPSLTSFPGDLLRHRIHSRQRSPATTATDARQKS